MPSEKPAPTPAPNEADARAKSRQAADAARLPRMGRYELIKHIATGGMGRVFRARDTQDDRVVALKILDKKTAEKQGMLDRFKREVRSAMKLKHEHIVNVFDSGEVGGNHYMAMEFIAGDDLHDYVKRKGPLDPEEARQIVLQAARALQHASDLNIVHRDVKPSNFLMLRKNGRPFIKLTDFGLAREVSADEFRVTRAGTTVGTVDYMSPEQARDSSAADVRSDLYSLGSTWYHLLTGQAPFPEGGLGERLIKIMTEQPADARDLNDRVSDDTWAILSKLLEKDPDDRYQTPEELIKALIDLEGAAAASMRAAKKPARKKTARKPRPDEDTAAEAPATVAEGKGNNLPYFIGGGLALCAVVAVVVALAWPKSPAKTNDDHAGTPPITDPIIQTNDGSKPPPKDADNGKEKDKGTVQPPPKDKDAGKATDPVVKAKWPALYKPAATINAKALRDEAEKPFTVAAEAGEPFVARVSRVGGAGTYRGLAAAVAAAPSGRPIVIEVHDNGPLFELPVRVSGRSLTVRAGEGFRPLILWDLQATVDRRRRDKKTGEPLILFDVRKGSLSLQGLELAFRWSEGLAEAVTLLAVSDGRLSVSDCTVSAAGKPHDVVTLARVKGESPRVRFTRMHARGQALAALDLDAAAGEVLLDGCLINAGNAALIRASGGPKAGPNVRLVRSTLLAGKSLIDLRPASRTEPAATLNVLAWDCLLARVGTEEGALLHLRDNAETRAVSWRAVNSLYVGWRNLLAGTETIAAADVKKWRERWRRTEGDETADGPWPESAPSEPGTQAASAFEPSKAVGFASTLDADKPLGCDLSALPPSRDAWVELALDPNVVPIEAPADGGAPEIPALDDGCYHGGKFDLTGIDLGAELAKLLKDKKPGPKVVLHLSGKGDSGSSPIRLKGASLVLYFEEPADEKTPRPMLKLTTTDPAKALLDVEDGSVEVINGGLKIEDKASARGACLIRVKGGDLRLYRTRLEGPQTATPAGWQSAVSLAGSNDVAPEKARICAVNECVILSSKAGIVLDGVGVRLLLRQSLLVAGSDALVLRFGAGVTGRTNVQCALQQSTIAARSAMLRLGDAEKAGVISGPAVVEARDCAFMSPFASSKAGLLVCEGESLSRGLLLWQGERDALDPRLWFMAKAAEAALPERREAAALWRDLWGRGGVKSPREVATLWPPSFEPKRWGLEKLIIGGRDPAGADLGKLGIRKR